MQAAAGRFEGGLADPVHGAQAGFQAMMSAMAEPGRIVETGVRCAPPAPMAPAMGLAALTLCDPDTPVFIDEALSRSGAVSAWLGFHTGAPVTLDRSQAAFAFLTAMPDAAFVSELAKGTQDYPDRSATLVVAVGGFADGPDWTLTGPGIRGTRAFRPLGIGDAFLELWSSNNALFPRGIDIIFTARDAIAALPRTTRIKAKEAR